MSWQYSFVTKIIRKPGETWFHKGNDDFYIGWRNILTIADEILIKDPSILQKNRFIVIEGPNLVETDSINDIMYTDMNGRRALSKDVKVLGWF